MPKWYDRWMYDWETPADRRGYESRGASAGLGVWTGPNAWPCRDGLRPGEKPADPEQYLRAYNDRIIANSDEFFSTARPKTSVWKNAPWRYSAPRAKPEPKLERKIEGQRAQFLRFHLACCWPVSRK